MIRYYLQLRTLSPLSITRHNNIDGLPNPSLPYIPGTTLRGAIAWHLRRTNPMATKLFQTLFDEEGLHCMPLYPLDDSLGNLLALPIPRTARTCKHLPGFRHTPSPIGRGHGVQDTLVAALEEQARFRLSALQPTAPAPILSGLAACEQCGQPHCDAPLQRLAGYAAWDAFSSPPQITQCVPRLRLLARTALLAELESARPGALFTREAIDSGQLFAGHIDIDKTLQVFVESSLEPGTQFYIGAARTAGMGKVEVVALDRQSQPLPQLLGPLSQRLTAFNQQLPSKLQQQWTFAPITLLSDLILLDPYLRASTTLEPTLIHHYLNLDAIMDSSFTAPTVPADCELFLAVNGTKRIASWNTAATPPRPRHDDLAVAAGSVFVLSAPLAQTAALTALAAALETRGLGERRTEGYGQLAVALPFHTQAGIL